MLGVVEKAHRIYVRGQLPVVLEIDSGLIHISHWSIRSCWVCAAVSDAALANSLPLVTPDATLTVKKELGFLPNPFELPSAPPVMGRLVGYSRILL